MKEMMTKYYMRLIVIILTKKNGAKASFFFFNINQFSTQLRAVEFYYVFALIWGTVVLWIHGIGFDIRAVIWRAVFMPWVGYVAGVISLLNNLLT